MAKLTQANRILQVITPLGPDTLLLVGFSGREAISQLYSFHLDLIAENKREIAFDKLLGQAVAVSLVLPNGKARYFQGICSRFAQGSRDADFTHYEMEIVPQPWLLTQRSQSRIFQHVSVPDILKKVLAGLDVTFEIQGTFYPRDYCVQYRETDFDFVSRLMEEEGIFYFFKHAKDGVKMIVANTTQSHPDLPEESKLLFDDRAGGVREEFRIRDWEKVQELRSGKYTVRDHCFELPHKHLEAEKAVVDAVQVGKVSHKLSVGGNDKLEIYDYPGGYAQRFDGVDPGGGNKPADLQKIFEDNKRTVEIRMQQTALPGLLIRGGSDCRQLVTGHKFTLERHFNADGTYVLTGVEHKVTITADYRTGESEKGSYENKFTCIPLALPFRKPLTTPKPVINGTQTAVVVGPAGSEEIFTDKYGRVKVQFHWDRQGKYDPDSSCWIRVSTIWAGKSWGVFHLPRRGQEVIVGFEEGDPDRPIILGSVYNAEMMPAKGLPAGKKVSGMKSASNQGGGGGYNEISFDDTHDSEMMTIHGQKDLTSVIEHDESWTVHNNRTTQIDGTETETIKGDTLITISSGTYQHNVAGNTAKYHVSSDIQEFYDANQMTKVASNITIQSGASIQITAATQIQLHVGASTLLMKSDGSIQLNGVNIGVDGSSQVNIHGGQILSSADGANNISGGSIVSAADGTNTVQGATVLLNP
jgi:type VI secretion system secreted protein VgrG